MAFFGKLNKPGFEARTTCPPKCLQQTQLHFPFRELNRSPEWLRYKLKTSPEKGENCFGIIHRQSSFTPHPGWKTSEQTSVCFCGCVFMPRQVWLLFGRVIYNFLCHFILLLFRSITVSSARYLSVKFRGKRTCLPAAFYPGCCFGLVCLSLGRLISKAWKCFLYRHCCGEAATRKEKPGP